MTDSDPELLGQFVRDNSQDAFTALVGRHLDLVYSAALRQVRSPDLAEEISQTVFTQLARQASQLRPGTVLPAWLYQVTRHTAVDVIRAEARRQAREQIAYQMSELHTPQADWTQIEPHLDEAMAELADPDRTALLLRFFENKSLREVGAALGTGEDAAQKRVSRALERLRDRLGRRRVQVGTGVLAVLLSAHAVQAAPAGLAAAVTAGAVLSTTILSTTPTVPLLQTILMTTTQKALIATGLAALTIVLIVHQARQASALQREVAALQAGQAAALHQSNHVAELERELQRATNRAGALAGENATLKKNPGDVLKLRGEVGRLRQANSELGATNALSKITADPAMKKLMRDQQKMGMGVIFKGFAQTAKLTTEQSDQLNDLLADHVMDNVGHVTTALRDKASSEELNHVFAAQEAALQDKIQTLLGPDGLAQYQDYSKNLLSSLTAEQFKTMMSGTDAEKSDKARQLSQALQQQVTTALTAAGLPADYQTVPILNFANIASETQADQSLQLLSKIYQAATASGLSFLSAEEQKKFQDFTATAITNNRAALGMNRTLMAPIAN